MQEEAGIRREYEGRGLRVEVEVGSKPAVEGVKRALRFCVMLSSIEAREMRRKSFRARVLKQNCGVSGG